MVSAVAASEREDAAIRSAEGLDRAPPQKGIIGNNRDYALPQIVVKFFRMFKKIVSQKFGFPELFGGV